MNLKKLQSRVAKAEEALQAIKALAQMEFEAEESKQNAKLAETSRKADKKAKDVVVETDEDRRGYVPRNGRMDIIREVVQKMGTKAATADVLERVNEVSVERGLKPIKKAAFYTLISEVRRERSSVEFKPNARVAKPEAKSSAKKN